MTTDSEYERSVLTGLTRDLEACYANLTAVQARCTELLTELRRYQAVDGIVLRGWNCPACKVFNGEEKSHQQICRACGQKRPERPGLAL